VLFPNAYVEGFIPREIVEACVGDYHELPPQPGISFRCFGDAASGVINGDSYCVAVSHKLGDQVVIDAIREVRPPFSPAEVIQTVLLPLCRAYNVHSVTFDNYAAGFAQNLVRGAGLTFDPAKKHKSELFLDPFLPLLNSRKIRLPRNERAINQICALERSAQRSGRDQISHPTHGHDDIANVIAGAAGCRLQPLEAAECGFGNGRDRSPGGHSARLRSRQRPVSHCRGRGT